MSRPALRPVRPPDYEFLNDLFTHPSQLSVGRLRGATPSPEGFHRFIWESVLAQFMVVVADEPIGIVSCYEPDLRNGTASIAVHAVPEVRGTGRALLGLSSFVDYLFATFPLRKLYAEVLADNMGPFARASGVYEIEGIFRAHEYVDGRYSDLHVLAVHRERWIAHRQAVERFAAG